MILRLIALLLLADLAVSTGRAAEWQWSIELKGATSAAATAAPRAFLWLPPDAPQIRAVIVTQQSLAERTLLEHPALRATFRELGLAVVLISPAFDLESEIAPGAETSIEPALRELAQESGYAELAFAPIVPLGHAATSSFPWNFARRLPTRTLAVISLSGQWPYGDSVPTPDAVEPALNGLPGLVVLGEYEWAEERAAMGLAQRAAHPGIPLTFLGEAAGGHFDLSAEKIGYLALYLRKVVAHRLPTDTGQPYADAVGLRYVDPLTSGWLADRWRGDEPARVPAAPVDEYAEPEEAFWCFDAEHAVATEKFRLHERGKRVALLGFVQDAAVVPQLAGSHAQVVIPFRPREDGLTFQLGAAFLSEVPRGRPERWTGLPAGAVVSRPEGGGPVQLDVVGGPVLKRDDGTFAVHFDRFTPGNAVTVAEIWLVARHPGDARHRGAVQQAVVRLPLRQETGSPQRLTFPALADLRRHTKSIQLGATSDAGTPVRYFVREGPAAVEGEALVFTPIPRRARLPVRVTVVAWNYGRATKPEIQSAVPVERTFRILP